MKRFVARLVVAGLALVGGTGVGLTAFFLVLAAVDSRRERREAEQWRLLHEWADSPEVRRALTDFESSRA